MGLLMPYRYLYMTGDEKVPADFDQVVGLSGKNTAIDENGGPVHHSRSEGHEYATKVV